MLSRLARRLGTGRAVLLLRLVQYPVVVLLRLVERLLPLDEHRVVFGAASDRFADNAAYAFIAASRTQGRALEPIWITGSPKVAARLRADGLRVAMRWSLEGLYLAGTAAVFVVSTYRSDVNHFLGHRALLVNLWHGVPIKRIERDIEGGPLAVLNRWRDRDSLVGRALAVDLGTPDHLVSPSPFVTESCLLTAFGIGEDRCWNLGYPRNDHLDPTAAAQLPSPALIADTELWQALAGRRVVGFFPTWRDQGGSVLDLGALSIQQLAAVLAEQGTTLLYKPHYNDPPMTVTAPGLVVLEPDEDVHAYLSVCDVLVTDYSSLAVDFALTGRPIIHFVPDLASYEETRGFYFHPSTLNSGVLVTTAAELLDALDRTGRGERLPGDPGAVASKFWGERYDFRSCERLVARLERARTERVRPAVAT